MAKYCLRYLKKSIFITDQFIGTSVSGNLNAAYIDGMLKMLKGGIIELMCHPGYMDSIYQNNYSFWKYNPGSELNVLLNSQINDILKEQKIKLISYREI